MFKNDAASEKVPLNLIEVILAQGSIAKIGLILPL
jgi:hypothetical protein